MPFKNLSAVTKMKLDSDQFGFCAEERTWLMKLLKITAVHPAFVPGDGPQTFPRNINEMPVAW